MTLSSSDSISVAVFCASETPRNDEIILGEVCILTAILLRQSFMSAFHSSALRENWLIIGLSCSGSSLSISEAWAAYNSPICPTVVTFPSPKAFLRLNMDTLLFMIIWPLPLFMSMFL